MHECCNYDDGNCIALDDGEECVCVQSISYSLLCRWFRAAVLQLDKELETALFHRWDGKRWSLYQQVEYVLQRGVNSAVEYAMKDEYSRDGYALMDTELAEETLYEYLHESMELDSGLNKYAGDEWVYELEIENLHATESPPRLTLDGAIRTHSIFAFLPGEIELPFTISSVNTQITEGGTAYAASGMVFLINLLITRS